MSRESFESGEIKSVTLADLQFGAPSPYDRIAGLAKAALMVWGAVSFGAAAGTAAFYFAGAPDESVLVGETTGSIEPADAPDPESQAAFAEIPPHLSEYVTPQSGAALEIPAPLAARLPRPRPDEPLNTGSIVRAPEVHARVLGPCAALERLGAPFPFRVRCERQVRVYAPPRPHDYYGPAYGPAPYYVPYVVR